MLDSITPLLSDPAAWAALVTLVVMEVVLGIDNLIFISILSNKLPENQRQKVRRIGIGLALIMRLALLSIIAWLVGLVQPVFTVMGNEFSWKDLILIAGGLFLVWKATKEIHHKVDPDPESVLAEGGKRAVLLIIQGMDTSGKGGIMRHVVGAVDPQGVAIAS